MITFFVPGHARPKQSFRYTSANGRGGGYTPAHVKAWADAVALVAHHAISGWDIMGGPVEVELTFFMPDNRRVDLDNLSKCVLDAMNGIIWHDDTQVRRLVLEKRTDKAAPGVNVKIKEYTEVYK